jgi:hypothetical protein
MHLLAALDVNVQNDAWSIAVAVATIVAALGTVGAIIVALFLPGWQAKRTRPKLTVETEGGALWGSSYAPADDVDRPNDVHDGPVLLISNAPGRETAHRVEVLLTVYEHTEQKQPHGWTMTIQPVTDRPLNFSENDGRYGTRTTNVGPGATRRVYFMRLGDAQSLFATWYPSRDAKPPTILNDGFKAMQVCGAWATVPAQQDNLSYVHSSGSGDGRSSSYYVELLVTGDNFDALRYRGRVQITLTRREPSRGVGVRWLEPLARTSSLPGRDWPWSKDETPERSAASS